MLFRIAIHYVLLNPTDLTSFSAKEVKSNKKKKKIAQEDHQENFLLFSCLVFDKTYALCVLGANTRTLSRCKIRYYHSYGTIDMGVGGCF